MKIVNLTPHTINVRAGEQDLAFEPTAPAARVASSQELVGTVDGIPVNRTTFGQVENLPEPIEGTIYIVSALVLSAISGRQDVVAPDTGPTAIRENGQVKAVIGFVTR